MAPKRRVRKASKTTTESRLRKILGLRAKDSLVACVKRALGELANARTQIQKHSDATNRIAELERELGDCIQRSDKFAKRLGDIHAAAGGRAKESGEEAVKRVVDSWEADKTSLEITRKNLDEFNNAVEGMIRELNIPKSVDPFAWVIELAKTVSGLRERNQVVTRCFDVARRELDTIRSMTNANPADTTPDAVRALVQRVDAERETVRRLSREVDTLKAERFREAYRAIDSNATEFGVAKALRIIMERFGEITEQYKKDPVEFLAGSKNLGFSGTIESNVAGGSRGG